MADLASEPSAAPRVVTLGCRLNTLESEIIRREAVAAGLGLVTVVNTCAVTAEAVRQARQTIRRLRRQHPERQIVVTGCAAQLSPESFAAMPEVHRVLGNTEKLDREHLAADTVPMAVADISTVRETAAHLIEGFEGRSRAFVQIQQGCDHRCTFCIIPFARGRNRAVPVPQIVAQVQRLVANGYREVVLTGVDICSYGAESADGPRLGDVVAAILARVPELARLRLSSLDPAAIDERLYRILADEPRLMPHMHLSLQSADDLVLKRMKRRHGRDDAGRVIARMRDARPDVVFGADLIAGFPTESEAMFANTLAAVEDFGLTWLHVFPYSARDDTPAARMPQVPERTRRERAARLRSAGDAARQRLFASRVGRVVPVLVEREGLGRCPWYAPVRLQGEGGAVVGEVIQTRITGWEPEAMVAEVVA